ncbi:hypothetical protein PsorP6_003036 [Peronosclerospora sorghi]|uniref:Uncharacterized protein n=1 Tax=Peronosclerospora sorghi TaxID=230839 RepID=A0ACC0VRR4_9STRA|nr:hypothetical protein PsorP6_003036 [Peronosclerospora sorghi]
MNMDAMFHVLFESKFEDAIRVAIKTNDERYVDIGLYVAVLRYVGGSTRRAVILIETAKKRPEHKTVAEKMEHGQFFLWSIVPLSKEDAAKYIFRSKQTDKVDALLQRYDAYLNADLTPEEVKTALELLKTFLTP